MVIVNTFGIPDEAGWVLAQEIPEGMTHPVFRNGSWVSDASAYVAATATTIPASVTPRQFKRALLSLDLLDDVDAMIAASGDRLLQIDWGEALSFDRTNPFITQMAAALGKTEAEVDALFILAATL